MPNHKLAVRLEKLEATTVTKRDVHIEFVAALPTETDIEAIVSRLEESHHEEYEIVLFRRKGSGFETAHYTKDLLKLDGSTFYSHPAKDDFIVSALSKDELNIMWNALHCQCSRLDGINAYDINAALKLD